MNKIEKIKKALDEATPNWHDNGNEIVSRNNPNMGIGGFLKEEDNHLAANAPEWLRWQQSRIEQLEKALQTIIEHEQDFDKNDFFAYSQLKDIASQVLVGQDSLATTANECQKE